MADRLTPEALHRLADEDLMTLVERRDADAFAVLYDRHGGAAYSLAHRIVGDPAVAEDVTQEAFLSVWRSGARFDAARGSVRSWTLGIVRNRAIDALRRASSSAPKLDLDDDAVLESQSAGELTDSEAIRRETSRSDPIGGAVFVDRPPVWSSARADPDDVDRPLLDPVFARSPGDPCSPPIRPPGTRRPRSRRPSIAATRSRTRSSSG